MIDHVHAICDKFQIYNYRSQNFFDLNEDTGELSTVTELDREFMSIHYFKVVATIPAEKSGVQTATTTVQVMLVYF